MRVLPERTTDAWTAWYLLHRFPSANLWAPTQNDPLNWDFGFHVQPGKGFVLETKGVLSNPHRVRLQLKQLAWYADEVATARCTAVYYVLPVFPWPLPSIGSPPAVAPLIGDMRQLMPFEQWTFMIDLEDLVRFALLKAGPAHARGLAAALQRVGGWKQISAYDRFDLTEQDLLSFIPRVTLEDFCNRIHACDASVAFHYFARPPTGEMPRHAGIQVHERVNSLTEPSWASIAAGALETRRLEADTTRRPTPDYDETISATAPRTSILAVMIPGASYEEWRLELKG